MVTELGYIYLILRLLLLVLRVVAGPLVGRLSIKVGKVPLPLAEVTGYLRLAVTILGHGYLGLILFGFEYWNDNIFAIHRLKPFTGLFARMASLEVSPELIGRFDATDAADLLAPLLLLSCGLFLHILGSVHIIE